MYATYCTDRLEFVSFGEKNGYLGSSHDTIIKSQLVNANIINQVQRILSAYIAIHTSSRNNVTAFLTFT